MAGHHGSPASGHRYLDYRGRPGAAGKDCAVSDGTGGLGQASPHPSGLSRRSLRPRGRRGFGRDHQTVLRCLRRAVRFGVMAALEDSPRPGKTQEITVDARAWLTSLACRKAKDLGYPHELWTTRLLARHVREHAVAAGHPCVANIAQGTV